MQQNHISERYRSMQNATKSPLSVDHSPTSSFDGFGSAIVFYFQINIIFIIIQYMI
jgi:hypothetical protein